jgi:hypothetical protein
VSDIAKEFCPNIHRKLHHENKMEYPLAQPAAPFAKTQRTRWARERHFTPNRPLAHSLSDFGSA